MANIRLEKDGNPKRLIDMATNITESKRQQEALKTLAHYDILTDLPNRNFFTDRFLQVLTHSHITKTQLAICYLELDNFKPINDQFGHSVGDQLLVQVANTLKENINDNDTVSRQGGDEFVLLLSDFKDFSVCQKKLKKFSAHFQTHFRLTVEIILFRHPVSLPFTLMTQVILIHF